MDESKSKKPKLDMQSDAKVSIFSAPSSSAEKIDSQLKVDEPSSSKSIIHDGFIELQGEKSIQEKLNRPIQIGDIVVLTKSIPDEMLFKGYCCEVASVSYFSENPSECEYQIIFYSSFNKNDRSLESLQQYPDFEFPSTYPETVVSGNDIVRLELQDLQYKTFFL